MRQAVDGSHEATAHESDASGGGIAVGHAEHVRGAPQVVAQAVGDMDVGGAGRDG